MFGSMAKPSPSATHGNSYFKFSGLSRDGKVDKLITPRHLQALERLLHSQHVFAHQFTSQGVQHFLWAWQSLSPSNIFKPCTRAYERCMRRIYGTLKERTLGPNAHVWSKHDYDMPVERCIAELSEFTQF